MRALVVGPSMSPVRALWNPSTAVALAAWKASKVVRGDSVAAVSYTHLQLEQNRLSSGTTGFCITAVAASPGSPSAWAWSPREDGWLGVPGVTLSLIHI